MIDFWHLGGSKVAAVPEAGKDFPIHDLKTGNRPATFEGDLATFKEKIGDGTEDSEVGEHLPYLKNGAELIIPTNSPHKYRWWAGGQSLFDTLVELDTPDSVIEHYVGQIQQPAMWKRWQAILEERIAARPVAGRTE